MAIIGFVWASILFSISTLIVVVVVVSVQQKQALNDTVEFAE